MTRLRPPAAEVGWRLPAFLLFAAALLVVGPAEASRTTTDARSNLAPSSSLELPPLVPVEPIDPVESSRRFGFAEDLGLLDPEAGPGCFVLFAAEAAQCELTYARNNPLKYVDPDGREEMDAVLMSTQRMQLREMGGEAAVQRFDRTNLAMGGAALAGLAGGALLAPAEAALGGSTLPGLTSEVFNWGLSARGFAIEGAAASAAGGGALIRNFPTIDRFMNGLATSVKSLDLLSKTYQQGGRVLSTLTGYIDKLASFDGARRGGQVVGGVGSEIQRKMLEVAIQKGVATPQQIEQIKKAVEYAKTQGVGVRIYFVADK